jgi:signal transduction histidine kinase
MIWRTFRRCLLALAGACALLPLAVRAEVLELTRAQAVVTVDGRAAESGEVTLPYHWDSRNPGKAGRAVFTMAFALDDPPGESYGLFLGYVGNAYEIWFNGALLQRQGDMARSDGANYAQEPRYVVLPPQLLRRQNLLEIRIRADVGRRGGLMPPRVGPDAQVRPYYQYAMRWQLATLVTTVLTLMVGGIALVMWLTQVDIGPDGRRRRDRLYLYAALAEFCWALRLVDKVIETQPLSWLWYGVVHTLALSGWTGWAMMFCVLVAGWWQGRPRLRVRLAYALWTFMLIGGVAAGASIHWQDPRWLTLWYGLALALLIPFCAAYLWTALRRGANSAHRWLAAALTVNVAASMRDWIVYRLGLVSYDSQPWARYFGLLIGLVLLYIVTTRFRAASAQARELSANLAERVAQKEAELAESYQRVEALAREQERAGERARILRDMHDGVGAHISTAIRQLQSGDASRELVLLTLRDSLDQLKLSIDAMHLEAGDVAGLLANLRYRLEPRLKAAGIELEWAMEPIKPLPGLDGQAMRQLQFMVFEALSNVLQHAQASRLRIEARAEEAGVRLYVIDNGRGFDASQPPRKGLLSMRERAAAIGAALTVRSAAGGTEVEIRWPG